MTASVVGSASSVSFAVGTHGSLALSRGGDAEPNTEPVQPVSRELGDAIAKAHRSWAELHAPALLQEWANV